MALAMTAFAVPAMAADNVNSETAFDQALENGDSVINLSDSFTISDTSVISSGVTINGNGNTITFDSSDDTWAFNVCTTDNISFDNLTIDASANNKRGIFIYPASFNLSLNDVTIKANIHAVSTQDASNSKLTITNSHLLNSGLPNGESYATWSRSGVGDYRGISLYNPTDAQVTINKTEIKGFGYSINIAAANTVGNSTKMKMDIDDSQIWGWSAFNVWTIGNTFDITNTDLRGINCANGGANNFGTIQLNRGIYGSSNDSNVFNIEGGSIGAYQYGLNYQWPINIADELRTQFHFTPSEDGDPVIILFDKNSAPINFVGSGIDPNTYLSQYVTGLEDNCAFYQMTV